MALLAHYHHLQSQRHDLLSMTDVVVGSAVSATGTGSEVLDELVADVAVTLPSIGRAEIKVPIKPSRTDILLFT